VLRGVIWQYELGHGVPALSASDMVALAFIFDKYDESGDGKIDLEEFEKLAFELVRSSFLFTGRETLESLDIWQLHILRSHTWKRRKEEEMKEGQTKDNLKEAINAKNKSLQVAKTAPSQAPPPPPLDAAAPGEDAKVELMYRITKPQMQEMRTICAWLQSTCRTMTGMDDDLYQRAEQLIDEDRRVTDDLVPFLVELKSRIAKQAEQLEPLPTAAHAADGDVIEEKPEDGNLAILIEKYEYELRAILVDNVIMVISLGPLPVMFVADLSSLLDCDFVIEGNSTNLLIEGLFHRADRIQDAKGGRH